MISPGSVWGGIQVNSGEKRMLFRSSPFRTTSRPPDLIIHSRRWSRYSRLNSPFSTSSATLAMPVVRAMAAISAVVSITDGLALARPRPGARPPPRGGGGPLPAGAVEERRHRQVAPAEGLAVEPLPRAELAFE